MSSVRQLEAELNLEFLSSPTVGRFARDDTIEPSLELPVIGYISYQGGDEYANVSSASQCVFEFWVLNVIADCGRRKLVNPAGKICSTGTASAILAKRNLTQSLRGRNKAAM